MQTISGLERVAAAHWRGTEEEWLGEWLLRAADGFTGRANSALPLGDPGVPLAEALDVVVSWYRSRGLPPMISVPMGLAADFPGHDLDARLAARNWTTRPGAAFVMVAGLPLDVPARALPAGRELHVTSEPDDAWIGRYHYRGAENLPPVARKVLTSAGSQSFVSIRDRATVLAIARLSVADGWAGITAVEVAPEYRRRGLGTAITASACRGPGTEGIGQVFLQTEVNNAPARALYERLGFRYAHRYHYRIAPA